MTVEVARNLLQIQSRLGTTLVKRQAHLSTYLVVSVVLVVMAGVVLMF